jgi:hypothetical protein
MTTSDDGTAEAPQDLLADWPPIFPDRGPHAPRVCRQAQAKAPLDSRRMTESDDGTAEAASQVLLANCWARRSESDPLAARKVIHLEA